VTKILALQATLNPFVAIKYQKMISSQKKCLHGLDLLEATAQKLYVLDGKNYSFFI